MVAVQNAVLEVLDHHGFAAQAAVPIPLRFENLLHFGGGQDVEIVGGRQNRGVVKGPKLVVVVIVVVKVFSMIAMRIHATAAAHGRRVTRGVDGCCSQRLGIRRDSRHSRAERRRKSRRLRGGSRRSEP